MTVRIVDNLPQFSAKATVIYDDALRSAARDGFIQAKTSAPFRKGSLRAESDINRVKVLHWRIRFWVEYARFQEFGGDARRRIKKYTTAGTGKGFLRTAGDAQAKKLPMTFKKHAQRIR